jgi:hypothetical protein
MRDSAAEEGGGQDAAIKGGGPGFCRNVPEVNSVFLQIIEKLYSFLKSMHTQ